MRRYRPGVSGFIADLHQDFRFEFAGFFFAIGILLVFIAFVGYVPALKDWAKGVGVLNSIMTGLGGYIFWEAIVAALVMLVGMFDLYDTIKKTREFEKLMTTTSKEVFLKNRKRVKHLAEYDLPERYWRRVQQKELDLKVLK